MEKRRNPSVTQEVKPVKPGGPDATLPSRVPTETQPFIALKDRPPEPPTDEELEAIFNRLRIDDPAFVREVEDALRGLNIPSAKVVDIRHIKGNRYRIDYDARKPGSIIVERKAEVPKPEAEHNLVEQSEL